MEVHFNQTYSLLFILAALSIAFVISFILYKKGTEDILSKRQKQFLATIRFIAFFLVALLLAKPIIKRLQNLKIDSVVVVAIDNSESMKTEKDRVNTLIEKLEKEFPKTNLVLWQFGEQANTSSEFGFNDKQSNYSNLLNQLTKNYLSSQVGGVLLFGDGVFNEGQDPAFTSKSVPFPIYTVGFGDTTLHVDAAIKSVNTNKQALLNNYFPVELNLDFSMASGQQANIAIEKEGKQIYTKSLFINSDQHFYSDLINLKAEQEGINNYQIKLSALSGEDNLANNSYEFSVQVIAKRQKILLLGSGAHPDLAALNKTLSANPNYKVELITGSKPGINFTDFDLVIAHQLPSKNRAFIPITENLLKSNRPVLFIVGQGSSVQLLNSIQKDIQIDHKQGLYENPVAAINEQFSLFKLSTDDKATFAQLPPLISPFGDIQVDDEFQSIAFQTVQGIPTNNPLIVMGAKNKVRRAYILGEGIWRWRLYDYLQNGSHQQVNDFFLKMANYLIVKSGEDNFNIHCQPLFLENEPVIMQAELFNASNELINEPNIDINILSSDSIEYHFTFDKQEQQYQLDAGRLPIGDYHFLATTELAGEKLIETGAFRVSPSQREILETKANFQVLNKIASNTGGQFVNAGNQDVLFDILKENQVFKKQIIKQTIFQELLDNKWLLWLVVFLFAMEWFLRKFWGTY